MKPSSSLYITLGYLHAAVPTRHRESDSLAVRANETSSIPKRSARRSRIGLKRPQSRSLVARLVGVLGLAVLAGLEGCSTQHPDIARMVMDAKTPADHEAIAAYYEKEAAANEAEASSHRQLAATYREFHNTYKNNMAPHCEIAADYYSRIAAQDSALALEHRELVQDSK